MVNQWGSLWSHWLAFKASPSPGFSKIPHSLRVFFRLLSVDQRSSNGRIWRRLVLAVGGGTAWSWILRIKPGCLENYFESFFVGSWDATLWIYLPSGIPFVTFLFLLNGEFFATSLEIEQWHQATLQTFVVVTFNINVLASQFRCSKLLWSPESIPILAAKKYAVLLKVFPSVHEPFVGRTVGEKGGTGVNAYDDMIIWSRYVCDMYIVYIYIYLYRYVYIIHCRYT